MTREQFAENMVFLFVGIGKPVEQQTIRVYFELLGHHDAAKFRAACAKVLLSHKWNSFPSIAELNEAAIELSQANQLTAGEAWAIARDAAYDIDPDLTGPHRVYHGNGKYTEYASQAESVLRGLPGPVIKAIEAYGLHDFCRAGNPDGVMRSQFCKIFESIAGREQRVKSLPPIVKAAIERARDEAIASNALAGIGGMPQ